LKDYRILLRNSCNNTLFLKATISTNTPSGYRQIGTELASSAKEALKQVEDYIKAIFKEPSEE
jgi:hypothetical protein